MNAKKIVLRKTLELLLYVSALVVTIYSLFVYCYEIIIHSIKDQNNLIWDITRIISFIFVGIILINPLKRYIKLIMYGIQFLFMKHESEQYIIHKDDIEPELNEGEYSEVMDLVNRIINNEECDSERDNYLKENYPKMIKKALDIMDKYVK